MKYKVYKIATNELVCHYFGKEPELQCTEGLWYIAVDDNDMQMSDCLTEEEIATIQS